LAAKIPPLAVSISTMVLPARKPTTPLRSTARVAAGSWPPFSLASSARACSGSAWASASLKTGSFSAEERPGVAMATARPKKRERLDLCTELLLQRRSAASWFPI
jgi:hypothetical protein